MRGAIAVLIVLGASLMGSADDKPAAKKSNVFTDAPTPKGASTYEALKKELAEIQEKQTTDMKEAQQAVMDAKTDAERREAQKKLDSLKKSFPGADCAARLLEFAEKHPKDSMAFSAAMTAMQFSPRPATKDNTLGKSISYLQDNYAAKPQIMKLVRYLNSNKYPAAEDLLREVLAKNSNHRIQGHACKALLAVSTKPGEKERLQKLLKGRYADLFPDLSEGKPAPEIEAKDVNDNNVWLSDLKGKVVVLDIWTTWCPHCRAMIPHERAMAEDWNVEYFPTIYVIDAKGIIRHTGLTGDDLEKAVMALIKETSKK